MSRPAKNSYVDALETLREHDRRWLDRTDTFPGVSLLAEGATEPSVLTLINSKGEVSAGLCKVLDGVSDILMTTFGTKRHDLVAAAHTIIALVSLLEAFSNNQDKASAQDVVTTEQEDDLFSLPLVTSSTVPTPIHTYTGHENEQRLSASFFLQANMEIDRFLHNRVNTPVAATRTISRITADALSINKRRTDRASADVPEFTIWPLLGKQTTTDGTATESLELFTQLLARIPSLPPSPAQTHRTNLKSFAESTLTRPIIGSTLDPSSIKASFPTVEDGFVAPGYRVTHQRFDTVASSESWWLERTEVRSDLDVFLAAHFTGPECVTRPLLVLGNPGAGKSLLVEVLAARLPESQFTTVIVPLRKVRAEDRVQEQVETALFQLLGTTVVWEQLAQLCGDSVPVVLLDGFDELVQASGVQQSNYLHDVQEFQRQQALLGRPVAVVVTSRVLVADRARIPADVPIVKLDEFDDDRIARWLHTWNSTNRSTAGFQPLELVALGRHLELARQPLLLLMLAIYATDSDHPSLDDATLSNAELYKRLITMFVERQAGQKGSDRPAPAVVTQAATQSSWRLGIAAFAMFNRGHQYVTAPELNDDLAVFAPSTSVKSNSTFDIPIDEADRTVENFFFIHSPTRNDGTAAELRTYEFLHATFGEYLVAEVTMKLLCQLAATQAVPSANPFQASAPPDDSQLYALISHQPFVKRKTIIEFACGLFGSLEDEERADVIHMIDDLIRTCQHRSASDAYQAYQPTSSTIISRIAHYSVNLVCLRALLDSNAPPLVADLFATVQSWRATVHLWKSGLDAEGWNAVTSTIALSGTDRHRVTPAGGGLPLLREARLLGDPYLETTVRVGARFASPDTTSNPQEQELISRFATWLLSTPGSGSNVHALPVDIFSLTQILHELDTGARMNDATRAHLCTMLARMAPRLPITIVGRALTHLVPRTEQNPFGSYIHNPFELVSVLCSHTDLTKESRISTGTLAQMFAARGEVAFGCVVLVWHRMSFPHGGDDDAFREFASSVVQAATPHLDSFTNVYLPVETFEYLAAPRTPEPRLTRHLLSALGTIAHDAADCVSPQIILAVINRFRYPDLAPQKTRLAKAYLRGRVLALSADDEPDAERLREIAEG
ncbi:hypothetical protein Lesp01_04280 [Lentzea sp. NBRC 102530]|nr:hypothetical protein Lesp01_04280 [Lentzea sp. NBRC 102530]